MSGTSIASWGVRRDFAKPAISVAGKMAIGEIEEGSDERKAYEPRQEPSTRNTGQQGKKCIQSSADVSIGTDEKGHLRSPWTIMLPKVPFGFFALVRQESHLVQAIFLHEPFHPLLGTHAELTAVIVDDGR